MKPLFSILFIYQALLLVSCNKVELISPPADDPSGEAPFRYPGESSNPIAVQVFDYRPAPGQFINDPATMSDISSPEEAAEWAAGRLGRRQSVSLGGFGGYIVVGFDHSVLSSGADYDFAVAGNAFLNSGQSSGGSNEPGIVCVMQDSNGNGLPDDEWYELAGSDTFATTTIRDYSVTYTRPTDAGEPVVWTDNLGQSGTVPYMVLFHTQESYYPAWIREDTYTLSGTRLESRSTLNSNGVWDNAPFGSGYADNIGEDNAAIGRYTQCNRFRIADARLSDGTPAKISFIDFVRIHTAVNAFTPVTGEVSTEIFGIIDLALYTAQ